MNYHVFMPLMVCGKYLLPPWNHGVVAKERKSTLRTAACKSDSLISLAMFNGPCRSIQDARLAFEIRKGTPVAAVFATRDVIARWAKMVLPNTSPIVEKVAELQKESANLGFHFEYETKRRRNSAILGLRAMADFRSRLRSLIPASSSSQAKSDPDSKNGLAISAANPTIS
jgi:hypothetical protein